MHPRRDVPAGPPAEFPVSKGAPAILHLDPPFVELGWNASGRHSYSRVRVDSVDNEALVGAARKLVSDAGAGARRLLVCLGSSLFDGRQVLLGHMPEEEARRVLARKAANAVRAEVEETLFWARRCEPPLEGATAAQDTWLVHTRRRSEHHDLMLRLREAGFPVARVFASEDVLTHLLDDTDGSEGHILVATTGHAVHTLLLRGRHLVQESELSLPDFGARSEVYTAMLRDVRQISAFWAKGSRGAPLADVHVLGFTDEEVESMRTPLEIATQGATVRTVACAPDGSYESLRRLLLQVFQAHGRRARDLSVPLPVRRSRVAAAAVGLSVAAAFGARMLFDSWTGRIADRRGEIEALREGSRSLAEDELARSAYLTAHEDLVGTIESLGALAGEGIALEDAIDHVRRTFDPVATVHDLVFEQQEATKVLLEGSLPSDLSVAARQLEELQRATEDDPTFEKVFFRPSTRVPDGGQGEGLSFTFTATLRGGDA